MYFAFLSLYCYTQRFAYLPTAVPVLLQLNGSGFCSQIFVTFSYGRSTSEQRLWNLLLIRHGLCVYVVRSFCARNGLRFPSLFIYCFGVFQQCLLSEDSLESGICGEDRHRKTCFTSLYIRSNLLLLAVTLGGISRLLVS